MKIFRKKSDIFPQKVGHIFSCEGLLEKRNSGAKSETFNENNAVFFISLKISCWALDVFSRWSIENTRIFWWRHGRTRVSTAYNYTSGHVSRRLM